MKPRSFLVAVMLIAAPVTALADPIESSERAEVERGAFACSTWVEPAGDQYEWTDLCGGEIDEDGDGDIDSRVGRISRSICDGDDPAHGSVCYSQDTVAAADVTAQEFMIDLDAGTASLHATIESCRVDADWTAVGPAQNGSLGEPMRVSPYVDPPAVYVGIYSRTVTYSSRDAALAGTVCPQAEVSGSPRVGYLVSYEDTARWSSIVVDPTA